MTDYGSIKRTGRPVNWTSLFPGGNGLRQGNGIVGEPLPEFFPEGPNMFVAHNYDGSRIVDTACCDLRRYRKCWLRLMELTGTSSRPRGKSPLGLRGAH